MLGTFAMHTSYAERHADKDERPRKPKLYDPVSFEPRSSERPEVASEQRARRQQDQEGQPQYHRVGDDEFLVRQ